MTEFKIGDKVRIPQTKKGNRDNNYLDFIKELESKGYSKDYLIVTSSDEDFLFSLEGEPSIDLHWNTFYKEDLKLYETTTKNLFEKSFELEKLTQFQRSIIKECCDIKKVPYYKTATSSVFEQSHFYKCIFWNGEKFHGAYNSMDLKGISFLEVIQALEEYQPVPEFKVGDNIIFLKKFDGRNVGDIATITRIDDDTYEGAKGWINYETLERKTPGGFRWEGNGYYVNIDFRFATPEEIAKWKEENELKLPIISGLKGEFKYSEANFNLSTVAYGCVEVRVAIIKELKRLGVQTMHIKGQLVSTDAFNQINKFIEQKEKE